MALTTIALLAAAAGAHSVPVAGALEQALRARYPEVARFEVAAFDPERAAQVPEAAAVVHLGARSAVAGADGRLVWFTARGYREVVVAAKPLAPRADVTAEDVLVAERDVLGLACAPLVDAAAITNAWTLRGVREGDVVCGDALAPKPPVVRGAAVTVLYAAQRVRITTTARAEHDARLGERVVVRNRQSGEIYYGVVSGVNEVTAHE
jgi:flagella basal body P-ring formation protein FlgA